MGSEYEQITPKLAAWIAQQRMFFVATAPLASDGCINCSPKGLDSFRILGPHTAAYLDLTGSGIETVAHLRENGRIVLMFCAFEGPPKIVRLHGRGTVLLPTDPTFNDVRSQFTDLAGARSLIHVDVTRISDSCGYGVPLLEFVENRDQLPKWVAAKGEAGLDAYRQTKNATSIDGLPGFWSSQQRDETP